MKTYEKTITIKVPAIDEIAEELEWDMSLEEIQSFLDHWTIEELRSWNYTIWNEKSKIL